jgi:uncharacterized membrane protein (DUF373 family)
VQLRDERTAANSRWGPLTLYQKFEQAVILVLTGLIGVVIVFALWNLALKVLFSLVLSGTFDPTDPAVFQTVFGMIFTVIIALEFKRSLLVLAERGETVVQVRTVILIAMLAVVRKLIILDLTRTYALELFGLAAAILALGTVYWLIRDQDRRQRVRSVASAAASSARRSGPPTKEDP